MGVVCTLFYVRLQIKKSQVKTLPGDSKTNYYQVIVTALISF